MANYFTPEQIAELTKTIALSSVKRYANYLKQIINPFDIDKLKDNPKEYIRKANNVKYNTSTLASLVKIAKTFSFNDKELKEYEDAFGKVKYNPSPSANRPANEKEKAKELSYDDLINLRKKLTAEWEMLDNDDKRDTDNKKLALQRLVVLLYTDIPPQRQEVFLNTKFDDIAPDNNFITFGKENTLTIVKGKRMKNRDPIIIELSDDVVNAMIDYRRLSQSDWLISKLTSKEPMKSQTFASFLNGLFGKNVGSSTLRNIIVSHMLDNGADKETMDKMALEMNHSPATQRAIYGKYSKKLHGDELDQSNTIKQLQKQNEHLKDKLKFLEDKLEELIMKN